MSTRTRSPGEVRFETEASIAPVPERGEQQDVVLGADEDFELGQHLLEEGAELRRAVVHVGGGHGELGGRQQRGGAGGIKASLPDHDLSLLERLPLAKP